jgi:hypothetical protein
MSPSRYSDRLSTNSEKERFQPEDLWKLIQDKGEVRFPPPQEDLTGCLAQVAGGHVWLVLLCALLGAIFLDWQRFGLDLIRLLPCLGALIMLALFRWQIFVIVNYKLVLMESGPDIIAEEHLVRVWRNTISPKDCDDAVPAPKGGIIICSKNGEKLLVGKYLSPRYSAIVADFFRFIIAEMKVGRTLGRHISEGKDTN